VSQATSRLNSDFTTVTSLKQVTIQLFYIALAGVIWLFVKWCWNFGIGLESQKTRLVIVIVLVVVVVVIDIDI